MPAPIPQVLKWGDFLVTDPRNLQSEVDRWTIRVIQDYENDKIAFELTGIEYSGPTPNTTYKATVIFSNPTQLTPYADAFEV